MRLLLFLPLLALAGCAAVDPGPSFGTVQDTVQARTGRRIAWNRGTPGDAQADTAVRGLLAHPLTADAAVQVALLNNRSLQASFEEIGISQADFVQAGLLANPSFSALIRFPNVAPLGADQEFSVTGDFLQLFVVPLRKKMAALQLEETELRVGDEVFSLAADVKKAFAAVEAGEQLVERMAKIDEIAQAALALAEKQHEAGNTPELDLATRQAAATAAQADAAEARIDLVRDREALSRLLGWTEALPAWTVAPFGALPALPADPLPAAALEDLALAQRLDVAAARKHVEVLAKSLGIHDATRFFPGGIDLGVDTEKNPDRSRVTGPSIDVQLPIFDQGQARAAVLQARLRLARDRLAALETAARSEVREARAAVEARRALAGIYRDTLLPQRVRVLQLSQEQYNYMLQGGYDLLAARQRELDAERAWLRTWRDYWSARADLERAVGGSLPTL